MIKTFLQWDVRQDTSPKLARVLDLAGKVDYSRDVLLLGLKTSLGYTAVNNNVDIFLAQLQDTAYNTIIGKINGPILETQYTVSYPYRVTDKYLALPKLPVIDVTSVTSGGTAVQSWEKFTGPNPYVNVGDDADYDGLEIIFSAGYTTMPQPILTAINLLAGDLFRNRNSNLENFYVPKAVSSLIRSYVKSSYHGLK